MHEVEAADESENFLVSMPMKFRKNVWIKRGNFVLVEPIEEGDKVKAEIVRILTECHVKEFSKEGIWPKKFTKKREVEDDGDSDGLHKNLNRRNISNEGGEGDSSSLSESD